MMWLWIALSAMMVGCGGSKKPVRNPLDNLNTVQQTIQSYTLLWDMQHDYPLSTDLNALKDFLSAQAPFDKTQITIEPMRQTDKNEEKVQQLNQLKWLVSFIQDHTRINRQRIEARRSQVPSEQNKFEIKVTRFSVHVPDCQASPQSFGKMAVEEMDNLGCSTNANLGLMIADPRDLVVGRTAGKSLAQPLTLPIDALKKTGKMTDNSNSSSGGNTASGATTNTSSSNMR